MNAKENNFFDNVVRNGYCIGCGGCAVADPNARMDIDDLGLIRPDGNFIKPSDASSACPFFTEIDEDEIGHRQFSSKNFRYDSRTGYYSSIYVGHVRDDSFRSRGGSSGFVTWILAELLQKNMIDGVIHVKPSADGKSIFTYGISTTTEELLSSAKSKYHPANFDLVVNSIRGNGNRYAFVGVPCFVKSIRLICQNDKNLQSQIKYCVALFCGHMKSAAYSSFISGQMGIAKDELTSVDFRVKDPEAPANRYRCAVIGTKNGTSIYRSIAAHKLYGMDWGLGYFKPKACDWCDDIVGELADISSGDAWLPAYVNDPYGNNVVIVRSNDLANLIEDGVEKSFLEFDIKSPDDVYASQAGNYRHRREGLTFRIIRAESQGVWHPKKRDFLDFSESKGNRMLYLHREELSEKSHKLFLRVEQNPMKFAFKIIPSELKYYWISKRFFRGSVKLFIQLTALVFRALRYRFFST